MANDMQTKRDVRQDVESQFNSAVQQLFDGYPEMFDIIDYDTLNQHDNDKSMKVESHG